MKTATTIKQGLKNITEDLNISNQIIDSITIEESQFFDYLKLDSKEIISIFWWRENIKFKTIFDLSKSKIGKLCSLKSTVAMPNNISLDKALFCEIDLAEWWLDSKVKSIMAVDMQNKTGNYILAMTNGTLANLEIACTLPVDSMPQYKHSLFGTCGMISDMVVDTVTVQDCVYLFSESDCKSYKDIENEMYGLNENEVDTAFFIKGILSKQLIKEDIIALGERLKNTVECAKLSASTGNKIII